MKTSTWIIAGVVVLIIAAGGIAFMGGNGDSAALTTGTDTLSVSDNLATGEVMEKKDGEAMMKKDGEAMEKKSGDVMVKKDTEVMVKKDTPVVSTGAKGTYEAYSADKIARANSGDVVLFFRASWCPTCRAVDADIKANLGSIPSGVTILDVNYDDSTALKQKYGVTFQHTFVQVDAQGNLLKKWSGSPTLAALSAQIK